VPVVSDATRTNLLGAAKIWRQAPLDRYTTISGVHFSLDEAAELAGIPCESAHDIVSQVLRDTTLLVSLLPRATGECNAELFSRMDMMLMVPEHYNTRLDRMTMSASVEARVPFQDLDLIGFVSRLSYHDLLRGGLKGMLRTAFADIIPPEIAERPKQTFQAPMLSWINGPLESWVQERLEGLPAYSRRSLDVRDLRPATTRQAYQVWSLALLEGWRRSLDLEY
jgi:asparagine synthase (glutamine-hydrolysing)